MSKAIGGSKVAQHEIDCAYCAIEPARLVLDRAQPIKWPALSEMPGQVSDKTTTTHGEGKVKWDNLKI
ncbi:MAG: hypothetical protein ACI9Z9_000367 [Litorivivens sp.]|jgi:hypothetical protein